MNAQGSNIHELMTNFRAYIKTIENDKHIDPSISNQYKQYFDAYAYGYYLMRENPIEYKTIYDSITTPILVDISTSNHCILLSIYPKSNNTWKIVVFNSG